MKSFEEYNRLKHNLARKEFKKLDKIEKNEISDNAENINYGLTDTSKEYTINRKRNLKNNNLVIKKNKISKLHNKDNEALKFMKIKPEKLNLKSKISSDVFSVRHTLKSEVKEENKLNDKDLKLNCNSSYKNNNLISNIDLKHNFSYLSKKEVQNLSPKKNNIFDNDDGQPNLQRNQSKLNHLDMTVKKKRGSGSSCYTSDAVHRIHRAHQDDLMRLSNIPYYYSEIDIRPEEKDPEIKEHTTNFNGDINNNDLLLIISNYSSNPKLHDSSSYNNFKGKLSNYSIKSYNNVLSNYYKDFESKYTLLDRFHRGITNNVENLTDADILENINNLSLPLVLDKKLLEIQLPFLEEYLNFSRMRNKLNESSPILLKTNSSKSHSELESKDRDKLMKANEIKKLELQKIKKYNEILKLQILEQFIKSDNCNNLPLKPHKHILASIEREPFTNSLDPVSNSNNSGNNDAIVDNLQLPVENNLAELNNNVDEIRPFFFRTSNNPYNNNNNNNTGGGEYNNNNSGYGEGNSNSNGGGRFGSRNNNNNIGGFYDTRNSGYSGDNNNNNKNAGGPYNSPGGGGNGGSHYNNSNNNGYSCNQCHKNFPRSDSNNNDKLFDSDDSSYKKNLENNNSIDNKIINYENAYNSSIEVGDHLHVINRRASCDSDKDMNNDLNNHISPFISENNVLKIKNPQLIKNLKKIDTSLLLFPPAFDYNAPLLNPSLNRDKLKLKYTAKKNNNITIKLDPIVNFKHSTNESKTKSNENYSTFKEIVKLNKRFINATLSPFDNENFENISSSPLSAFLKRKVDQKKYIQHKTLKNSMIDLEPLISEAFTNSVKKYDNNLTDSNNFIRENDFNKKYDEINSDNNSLINNRTRNIVNNDIMDVLKDNIFLSNSTASNYSLLTLPSLTMEFRKPNHIVNIKKGKKYDSMSVPYEFNPNNNSSQISGRVYNSSSVIKKINSLNKLNKNNYNLSYSSGQVKNNFNVSEKDKFCPNYENVSNFLSLNNDETTLLPDINSNLFFSTKNYVFDRYFGASNAVRNDLMKTRIPLNVNWDYSNYNNNINTNSSDNNYIYMAPYFSLSSAKPLESLVKVIGFVIETNDSSFCGNKSSDKNLYSIPALWNQQNNSLMHKSHLFNCLNNNFVNGSTQFVRSNVTTNREMKGTIINITAKNVNKNMNAPIFNKYTNKDISCIQNDSFNNKTLDIDLQLIQNFINVLQHFVETQNNNNKNNNNTNNVNNATFNKKNETYIKTDGEILEK
ncbi:uncharacterized protein LOC142330741 [Lycorma delicatula]|uniref:uncharacterized protein LOC142330741 n=1 Tax=Lycorma delicatula TaxID=130591 RepID=UPI003F514766